MTKLSTLLTSLSSNPEAEIQVMLPDGGSVPANFHVTEVGLVRKDFIDCGGTVRSSAACVIQMWVASDVHHRLDTTKLSRIFEMAKPLFPTGDLPVEVEYENGVLSQYPLTSIDISPSGLVLQLGSKHTACLAPQLCVVGADESCCGSSNCC